MELKQETQVFINSAKQVEDFTEYTVEVHHDGFMWRTKHRYSEFRKLHNALRLINPDLERNLLPPKKIIGKMSTAFIDKRREELELYLQTLVSEKFKVAIPRTLGVFLDFHHYEVERLTQDLAKELYTNGDSILAYGKKYVFTPLQLWAISQRLTLEKPKSDAENPEYDFGHVLDFVQKLRHLHIQCQRGCIRQSNIVAQELSFDLSIFRSLEQLIVDRCSSEQVSFISCLRRTLNTLSVHHSLTSLQGVLLEGAHENLPTAEVDPASVWSKLVTADFSENTICDIDISVRLLVKVDFLDLSKNEISKIENLQYLSSLVFLDLSHNQIETIELAHAKLGNVKTLNLACNKLQSLHGLGKLYSLEVLDVSRNQIFQIETVDTISKLPCLTKLSLKQNPVSEGVDYRTKVLSRFGSRASEIKLDDVTSSQKELDTSSVLSAILKSRRASESSSKLQDWRKEGRKGSSGRNISPRFIRRNFSDQDFAGGVMSAPDRLGLLYDVTNSSTPPTGAIGTSSTSYGRSTSNYIGSSNVSSSPRSQNSQKPSLSGHNGNETASTSASSGSTAEKLNDSFNSNNTLPESTSIYELDPHRGTSPDPANTPPTTSLYIGEPKYSIENENTGSSPKDPDPACIVPLATEELISGLDTPTQEQISSTTDPPSIAEDPKSPNPIVQSNLIDFEEIADTTSNITEHVRSSPHFPATDSHTSTFPNKAPIKLDKAQEHILDQTEPHSVFNKTVPPLIEPMKSTSEDLNPKVEKPEASNMAAADNLYGSNTTNNVNATTPTSSPDQVETPLSVPIQTITPTSMSDSPTRTTRSYSENKTWSTSIISPIKSATKVTSNDDSLSRVSLSHPSPTHSRSASSGPPFSLSPTLTPVKPVVPFEDPASMMSKAIRRTEKPQKLSHRLSDSALAHKASAAPMRATSSRQTRRRFTISPLLNMDLTSPAMRHLSHQTKPALLQYFRSSVMLEDEELLHISWCHVSTQDDSEQASCVFFTPHAFHIVHDERPNPKVPEFPRTLNFKAFQAEKSLSYLKKDTFPITAGPKQVNIGLSNLSLKITDSSSGNFIKFLTRSSSTNDLLLRGVLAALGVDERSFLTSKSEGRDFEYQPAKVRFVFNNESTICQLEKAFSDYLGPYREQCTSIVFYTSAWLRIPPGFDASLSGNDNTKFLDVLNHVESSIHSNQLSVNNSALANVKTQKDEIYETEPKFAKNLEKIPIGLSITAEYCFLFTETAAYCILDAISPHDIVGVEVSDVSGHGVTISSCMTSWALEFRDYSEREKTIEQLCKQYAMTIGAGLSIKLIE